jgi:hypothetical protein
MRCAGGLAVSTHSSIDLFSSSTMSNGGTYESNVTKVSVMPGTQCA